MGVSGSTVLAVGEFDGFHRGHQALLDDACVRARELGLPVVGVVLAFGNSKSVLSDAADRCWQVVAAGADTACLLEVGDGIADDDARAVAGRMAELSPVVVFLACSPDRSPRYPALRPALGELAVPIVEVPRVVVGGDVITAASVRGALEVGDVALCRELLGRPFSYRGTVTLGDQRGQLLGFPTANLAVGDNVVVPCDGVYAAWATLESGDVVAAAVNIGRRPTFYAHGGVRLVEAYLIGVEGDLYGTRLSIAFAARVRAERMFGSIESLRAQLDLDVAAVRAALALPQ